MRVSLLFHTILHLRWTQIVYQLRYRLHRAKYKDFAAPHGFGDCRWLTEPIARPTSWDNESGTFVFLNIADTFQMWDDMRHGALWAYNLNYMDWLNQQGLTASEGAMWIGRFIGDTHYDNVGFDPYPTALRCINWIKFICRHREELDASKLNIWNDSLYSQYRLLERRLEYHLLGNHLLEDAYSLCIGAIYFADIKMWRKAKRLLRTELTEQFLADGAHYEQSPMYHCILLDRLLDVYNISTSNPRFGQEQTDMNIFLRQKAEAMLGHLESITYEDGTYPLFNDAAEGIAPTSEQLKDYAVRFGLSWRPVALRQCGYRHLQTARMEAFIDVGGITAAYQPGHSHADALNYELRIDGKPFVVDTGISTYDKTPRRQYERSTAAHNTVTVCDKDSAEVWGGFRVGKRSEVFIVEEIPKAIIAQCNGIENNHWHLRKWTVDDHTFSVSDSVEKGKASISRIHLADSITIEAHNGNDIVTDFATIHIEGATSIKILDCQTATEYNRLKPSKVIEIHFDGECKYEITNNA